MVGTWELAESVAIGSFTYIATWKMPSVHSLYARAASAHSQCNMESGLAAEI